MRILTLLLLFAAACSRQAHAQGTFLFTWHGQSNYFQASFVLTDAEMQGAAVGSPEFTNSVSVSSLSGILYQSKGDDTLFLGHINPWTFDLTFLDFSHGTELFVGAVTFPIGGMAGDIREKPMSGSDLYFERGYWTYSAIPEPSSAALVALGAICLLRRESRCRSAVVRS